MEYWKLRQSNYYKLLEIRFKAVYNIQLIEPLTL